jgi:hypothetical protein
VALGFVPGDNLVFQLESGYGLIRVLAVEEIGSEPIWHLLIYEEFFPDVETAEKALLNLSAIRSQHMALTDRALERTPAAKLDNSPVMESELDIYQEWVRKGRKVSDRSVLLMLGIR